MSTRRSNNFVGANGRTTGDTLIKTKSSISSGSRNGRSGTRTETETRATTTASLTPTSSMLKKHSVPVLKILVIGDTGVGKSCLLLRFADDAFTPSFMPTIGIDFRTKEVELEGVKMKLQVWDTAGQDRFRSITNAYYRGAHGVMLVYDVTDSKSFHNVKNWMQNLDEHASGSVNRILVANKADMVDKRVIEPERGRALAEKYGVKFFETSAKTGTDVDSTFEALALEVKHRVFDQNDRSSDSSDESPPRSSRGFSLDEGRPDRREIGRSGERKFTTTTCCNT